MTIKQIFSLIGGGFVALLFAILGIQRKTIKKQKAKVKEAEEDVKVAEAKAEQAVQTVEIVKDAHKVEQAQSMQGIVPEWTIYEFIDLLREAADK